MIDDRYSRHLELFGVEGQRRLARQHVGIVGLGGLGSHVTQLLAYLGVTNYVLVDDDIVERSNLNRLIGATTEDFERARDKVEVAARTILDIQPDASVRAIPRSVADPEAATALRGVDAIFGCVDNDPARLDLVEIASREDLLYLDLASDIGRDGTFVWYGGRVLVADGRHCLSCAGLLDQPTLARADLSPEERQADDRIYGVERMSLDDAGPSVVSINGVVANLAVTEYVVSVTGLRDPALHLVYRGDDGGVRRNEDLRQDTCYYCDEVRRRSTGGRSDPGPTPPET